MEWEKAGENDVTAGADWSFSPENLFTASAVAAEVQSHNVRRAETAPTIMTEIAALADADIPESEAYRCTQEYHNFYYSHMPRDPRMPIPIKSRNANTNSQQPQSGSSTSVGSGAGTTPASSPWVVQKSSLTGDIVTHPHTRAGSGTYSNQPAMPGRVVTPATAQQMLNDPHAPIPHGSRVVYVTEPPKAVTPSTLYVLLPEGTAPPPGATVIHAPPSFLSSSGEPSRTGSGVSHLVSANGQILIATTPSPPNQFHSIPHMVAHPMPPPPPQGPSVVIGVRAPLNHPLAPGGNGTYRMQPSQLQPHGHHNASTSAAAGGVNATVVRHPLLQQYIDTKLTADWNARLIVGHIHHFCRDQDGSRFIQRQLDDSGENVPLIWNEAYPIALDLMCDVFGNYVIQKLFDVADDERRIKLVNLFAGSVMKLSLQTYGCRVLQKAFDSVPSKHIEFVAKELQGHIAECVFDQNANHVVQKCIEKLPSKCQFVADEFLADLSRLACHAYGCRVLQKLFEACYYSEARGIQNPYAPTDLTQLLTTVFHRLDELVVNQFGNYVVQHGMMNCSSGLQVSYIEKISPQVFTLSKSKFGSNVAEKTVELASEAQRGRIIDTLIGDETTASASPVTDIANASPPTRTPAAEPPLVTMMRDPFANYVVQKLMDRSSPDQQTRMVHVILPYVETIAQATFGKHLLTRMDKMGLLPPSVAATLLSTAKDPTNNTNAKGQQKDRKKQGTERAQTDRPAPAASAHKSAVVVAPPQAVGDATKGQQQPASKGSKRTHRRQRSTASSSASAGTLSAKPTPSTSPATMTLSPPSQTLGANASVTSASVAPRMQHMPYRSPTTDLIAQQHRHTLEDFSLESAPRQQQPQHPAAQYHPQQQQHQQPQQQAQQQQRFAVNQQQQQQQQQHSAPHFAPHYQHQQQPPPQQQPPMKSLYPYPHNVDGGASYRPVHQPQHQQQHYLPAATGYHQQPQQQQHQYGGPSPAQQPHQYTPNNGAVPNNAYLYQQQAQQQSRQDEVYAHHQYQPYPVPGGPTPSAYPVPQHVATLGGNGGHAPIDSSQQFHHYPQQQTAPPHSRPQQQQPSAWYDGNGWNINSGAGQPSHVRVGPGAAPPHRQ